ncbi:MAG: biotin-independent malonate decarboxylase subunit gamma [Verrucomicrobia bacterium]|nr:biotin-independent malonate decarboxylase subunit gamma [Verrucomicrobiota bacterium]MBV8277539.1 biotin-independent malonate decarboxylase subunit gamma [Verrucomicrobiota bacterium]
MSNFTGIRGRVWFKALTGQEKSMPGDLSSVLATDVSIGDENARFLCVVPDPDSRFPCARHGEVGLEQAYTLAARIREVIAADRSGKKRPIIAIVDVKSQAYGRREEIAGIHLAAAEAADAYATARFAGHPLITLIVGQAISGGFLTHGYQANRLLAFADDDVLIHAMHKEPAARITRRTVAQLEELAKSVTPLSYNIRDYAKLGLLYRLLPVSNLEAPSPEEISLVRNAIVEAIADTRKGPTDLRNRFESADAQIARKATRLIRARLAEQWNQ